MLKNVGLHGIPLIWRTFIFFFLIFFLELMESFENRDGKSGHWYMENPRIVVWNKHLISC